MSDSPLDRMIAELRALGAADLPAQLAKEAAPRVQEAIRATAAAGTTPEGQAWAPRKDGGRALADAAAHVTAKALGAIVRVTLAGPDVFHHFGKGSGEPRRRVIPDVGGQLPPSVAKAMQDAVAALWARIVGGAGR